MTLKGKRLGEMLLEAGVIDENQLAAALGHQRRWGGKLGQALVDLRLASEAQIVSALSRRFGYEVLDVAALLPSPAIEAAMKLVPRELAERQLLLPIAADTGTLTVVMADPSNIAVADELAFRTGRRLKIALAGDRALGDAVKRLYDHQDAAPEVTPIPLDDDPLDAALETTSDPFAAMPDDVRERYFSPRPTARPAAGQPPLRPAPSFGHPTPHAARPAPPAKPAAPGGPAAPQAAAAPASGPAHSLPRKLALESHPVLSPAADATPTTPPALPLRSPAASTAPGAAPPSPERVLDALEALARGGASDLVTPGQVAVAVARLLVKHGLLREADLVAELVKK